MNEHEDAEAAAWEEDEANRWPVLPDPRPPSRLVDIEALRRFRLEHLDEPCELCERRPGVDPHHRIYRSQSGPDTPKNLVWLCRACHRAVHDDGVVL